MLKNEPINIRNPEAIRPWQFVLEPLAGYLLLAKLMYEDGVKYSASWNFGPPDNDVISVKELVSKVISYWGKGEYKVEPLLRNLHEAEMLKLDCSKAHSLLGWYSVYNIERALEKTIEWYKRYYDGTDNVSMIEYSISQIREYRKRGDYYVGDQKDSEKRRC